MSDPTKRSLPRIFSWTEERSASCPRVSYEWGTVAMTVKEQVLMANGDELLCWFDCPIQTCGLCPSWTRRSEASQTRRM